MEIASMTLGYQANIAMFYKLGTETCVCLRDKFTDYHKSSCFEAVYISMDFWNSGVSRNYLIDNEDGNKKCISSAQNQLNVYRPILSRHY